MSHNSAASLKDEGNSRGVALKEGCLSHWHAATRRCLGVDRGCSSTNRREAVTSACHNILSVHLLLLAGGILWPRFLKAQFSYAFISNVEV